MSPISQLDAHQRPPDRMRSLFKKYQKCKAKDLHLDADIIDMSRTVDGFHDGLQSAPESCIGDRDRAFREFLSHPFDKGGEEKAASIRAFEVTSLPGSLTCLERYCLFLYMQVFMSCPTCCLPRSSLLCSAVFSTEICPTSSIEQIFTCTMISCIR